MVAFLALFVFGVPFPLVVLGAGVVGLIAGTRLPGSKPGATDLREAERVPPSWARTARVLAIGLAVWLVPLAAVALGAGSDSVLADEAVFFTIASLVTFGGAYAVLAYVNQAAVIRFGWLSASEMAVGLSLAETTPGPLIMVVVFVGFLAAYREPASLPSRSRPGSRAPWSSGGPRSSRASSGSSWAPPRSNASAATSGSRAP